VDFHFYPRQKIVPLRTTDLAKVQGRYFNLQAENITHFNNISSDDMYPQSVNNDKPVMHLLS
jgi:hypothetical protein